MPDGASRADSGVLSPEPTLLPVLMWMHHKMAVRPTPMTNEAKAMPTVTSVDTPTTMT
jgi:hypothetical protein